jgi:hypothetical protein
VLDRQLRAGVFLRKLYNTKYENMMDV